MSRAVPVVATWKFVRSILRTAVQDFGDLFVSQTISASDPPCQTIYPHVFVLPVIECPILASFRVADAIRRLSIVYRDSSIAHSCSFGVITIVGYNNNMLRFPNQAASLETIK